MNRYFLLILIFIVSFSAVAQDQSILVPKPIDGSPFQYNDSEDLFGKAYRWFLEGEPALGAGRDFGDLVGAFLP